MQQPPPGGRPRGQTPPYRPPVGGAPGRPPQPGQPHPPQPGQPHPGYGQPAYGQPAHGQPAHGQPVPGQAGWAPNYGQPQGPPPGASYPTPGTGPLGSTRPIPAKKRSALRFLAGSCVFSAWATLVISVLLAVGSFLGGFGALATQQRVTSGTQYFQSTPTPTATPAPTGETDEFSGIPGLGGGGATGNPLARPGLPDLSGALSGFQALLAPMFFVSGLITLVTGVLCFLLFLGLGQACYVLLDLEEHQHQLAQVLQMIVARLGTGR
jgi:hypothetical protein